MFYQTNHTQADKRAKNAIFVPGDLDILIMTFKLIWARAQTRFRWEFGANPFSGSPRYFINKQKMSQIVPKKQNRMQFSACGKHISVHAI